MKEIQSRIEMTKKSLMEKENCLQAKWIWN